MSPGQDRRKHRRLAIRLPIECIATLDDRRYTYRTVTHDVSSTGVSFESDSDVFPVGTALEIELGVPPGDGHSPYPGRVRGTGQVVRVNRLTQAGSDPRFRVAAHFSKPLKLVF
jgi:hypothetical protein